MGRASGGPVLRAVLRSGSGKRKRQGPDCGAVFSLTPEAFADALRVAVRGFCELRPSQAERLYAHYSLLGRWNRVVNLTGVRTAEELFAFHYAESLFLAAHLPAVPASVLDIGSGAGLPGIPVAVAREDCRVTLTEADRRKASFLREATRDWRNVRVHFGRAEFISETFDWAISRAVRPERVLSVARRRARRVGLLVGGGVIEQLEGFHDVRWEYRAKCPWGRERWLLLGMFGPGGSQGPV